MTAFDTDILSLLAKDSQPTHARVRSIPAAEQVVPIVVAEEILRGQLATIRRAQAGQSRITLEDAYSYFEETLTLLQRLTFLKYSAASHNLFLGLKAARIKIGSQDLRIAAICIVHGAKLVTRNARDYRQVPGLNLEIWN
jgi:tRNA(fMet)-specific endonuclease VapC